MIGKLYKGMPKVLADKVVSELLNSGSGKLTVLSGGRNHAVLAYDEQDKRLCIKQFHPAKTRQSRNEWNALNALRDYTEGIAPRPIRFIDGSDGGCVIVMEYLNGKRLTEYENVSKAQMNALANVLKMLYAMPVRTSSYIFETVDCNSSCIAFE